MTTHIPAVDAGAGDSVNCCVRGATELAGWAYTLKLLLKHFVMQQLSNKWDNSSNSTVTIVPKISTAQWILFPQYPFSSLPSLPSQGEGI